MLTRHSAPRERAAVNPRDELPGDYGDAIENTPWGPAHRLRAPYAIEGSSAHWALPAGKLGDSPPAW